MSDPTNPAPPGRSSGQPGPLTGQTVLVTRAAEQAGSLRDSLEQLGATTIAHPVIQILPPDIAELDQVIARIDQFDWIVFVSTNAVGYFVDRLVEIHGSDAKLKECKIAAIGKSTADSLQARTGVQVDLIPPKSNSESLGGSLAASVLGGKLLIARADRRSPTLTDILTNAKIDFEEVIAYRSCNAADVDPNVANKMEQGLIDWVTVTSGAIARSTVKVFGKHLQKTKLVSISPGTSNVLRELGIEPDAEAETYDMPGIVQAIEQSVSR